MMILWNWGSWLPWQRRKKRRQKYHNHGKVSILISKNHPKTIAVIHLPVQSHPKCRMLKKKSGGTPSKKIKHSDILAKNDVFLPLVHHSPYEPRGIAGDFQLVRLETLQW
jgi:hypothetical protein